MKKSHYTVIEAAAELGLHHSTIRAAIKAGEIVAIPPARGRRAQLIAASELAKLRKGIPVVIGKD